MPKGRLEGVNLLQKIEDTKGVIRRREKNELIYKKGLKIPKG